MQPEQELVCPHHRAALRAPMRRRQYLVALLCCFIAAAHTDLVLGKKLKGAHAQQKQPHYYIIAAYGTGHHSSPPGQIEIRIFFQPCDASLASYKHDLCKHAGHAVTAKQARLKKEEAEKCTDENASACYDHTGNMGIGPVKVMSVYGTANSWAGTLAKHACACRSHKLVQH